MKVAIVVFSPTGNTMKVGRMLEENLLEKKVEVQLTDITRDKNLFGEGNIREYLNTIIEKHDAICIGSPVYAHHMNFNVKNIIKCLPPAGNGWGTISIPFVTYGGISSGVALHEAALLLRSTGRTNIAGMKINSEHVFLTRMKRINLELNKGMPGDEALPLVDDLAGRIIENGDRRKCNDITRSLGYQSQIDKLKAGLIFREKIWQYYLYPKLVFDLDKCIRCGKCAGVCPVQRIEMTKEGPIIPKDSPVCIHCTSCIINCPSDAITFDANWEKWEKLASKAAKGQGPLPSNEIPKSAVYPIPSKGRND